MRCYFKLVGSDQTITDEEGLEVADVEEARTFAREAITKMLQEDAAEIARWREWVLEARDASGTVLFTMGFDALLPAETQETKAATNEDGTYTYDKVA
jgi:hypothetical protein